MAAENMGNIEGLTQHRDARGQAPVVVHLATSFLIEVFIPIAMTINQ